MYELRKLYKKESYSFPMRGQNENQQNYMKKKGQ